jgi:hypothetical protein
MPTAFFSDRGLVRLVNLHRRSRRDAIAPVQLQMVLGWE